MYTDYIDFKKLDKGKCTYLRNTQWDQSEINIRDKSVMKRIKLVPQERNQKTEQRVTPPRGEHEDVSQTRKIGTGEQCS